VLHLNGDQRLVTRWLAIILLVVGWVVPLALPHLSNDDLLCADITESGRPAQLKAWGGERAPAHCVICHAARIFRSSLAEAKPVPIGLLSENVLVLPSESFHDASTFDRLAARAPPLG
jgi:hypothetical protein